jgi:hypothetical protein
VPHEEIFNDGIIVIVIFAVIVWLALEEFKTLNNTSTPGLSLGDSTNVE